METTTAIIIVLQAVMAILVIIGFLHEDVFIRFENKMEAKIQRKIRIKKRNLCAEWLAKDGLVAVPISDTEK